MPPLKILICGGGCAGPALAYWLSRRGHRVTLVERFPALRAAGAQIDLRAQGITVAQRMGLLDRIREEAVHEAGISLIDSSGTIKASMSANRSGHGAQSFSSEYEIMRGDLVRILYDATKDTVEYAFGKTVESFEQHDDDVVVHFSDGTADSFDLLVGADGQGSRIRRAMLQPQPPPLDAPPDPYWRTGLHIAYFFIPRAETDDNVCLAYPCPQGRLIMRRTHSETESQVYFILRDGTAETSEIHRRPVEEQKAFWAGRFHDAGWQTTRFLEGLRATENFYCQEVVQIRADAWSKGRVVLLGDAAHCSSPFSAMGTTGALVGAYVLAGEIARHSGDLPRALRGYEETLRPFVNEIQKFNRSFLGIAFPESRWGVKVLLFVAQVLCFLRIPDLLLMFVGEERGGWKLPEYPELMMEHEGSGAGDAER